jgi:hypothetical protein
MSKYTLQLIWYAIFFGSMKIFVKSPFVDELPEFRCHVKRLKKTVHVACGALVAQSDVSGWS